MNEATTKPVKRKTRGMFFYIGIIAIIVVLNFWLVHSLIYRTFYMPSASMTPTVLIGDYMLVNKLAYGLRHPFSGSRLLGTGTPQRGDLIVFRVPGDEATVFIKRVMAIPGDSFSYDAEQKTVSINGKSLPQQRQGAYADSNLAVVPMAATIIRQEQLDGKQYQILIHPGMGVMQPDLQHELTLGEGEYFVMGDSRDNSRDSRYWGTVPDSHLVGRVELILFNASVEGRSFRVLN